MYEKLYTYINVQLIHRFFFKNYTFKYYSADDFLYIFTLQHTNIYSCFLNIMS